MINILFNAKKKNIIGSIEIDATLEVTHDRQTEVTDNPVENGSFIQDHIVNAPKRFTMVCMITDTPLNSAPALRAQSAFDALEELRDSRQLFTVVTGLKVYENVAFETLSVPETRESAIRFTATFKQLTLTSGQVVPIESVPRADPKLRNGNVSNPDKNANGSNVGRQKTSDANANQESRTSVLKSIFG